MVAQVVLVLFISASVSPGFCSKSNTCKTCPPGWTGWGNNCYRFYNQPRLNFADSEDFCTSFGSLDSACPCHTPHLASVGSEDENNFLHEWWKSMREPTTAKQHVRVGYTDNAKEGTWKWSDGARTSYTAWENGQPDDHGLGQDCAVMRKLPESSLGDRGTWDDESCQNSRAFFCKFSLLD